MMLSDICLSRTSGLSRKQRGLERPKLAHHFQGQKVKGQGHQAALLTAAFTHQAAAAVSVGTYSPWEPTTIRCGQARSARRRMALGRPQREERGGGIL